jgi:uncharacterized protein (DUF427 family)
MKKAMENIWAYPRPPALVRRTMEVRVVLGGAEILHTNEAWTVCEESHPPTWYFQFSAFAEGSLRLVPHRSSYCEWKGIASYYDVIGGDGKVVKNGAWSYDEPTGDFGPIAGHVALYASQMDSCTVDGEQVVPQPGSFYGGWLTPSWVDTGKKGMKGRPGTEGW